jgi:hypothetical protein
MGALRFKQIAADDQPSLRGVEIAKRIASLALEERLIAIAKDDVWLVSSLAHARHDLGQGAHVAFRLGVSCLCRAGLVQKRPYDPVGRSRPHPNPVSASLATDIGPPNIRIADLLDANYGLARGEQCPIGIASSYACDQALHPLSDFASIGHLI